MIEGVSGNRILGFVNIIDDVFEIAAAANQHADDEDDPRQPSSMTRMREDAGEDHIMLRYSAMARSQPRRSARFHKSGVG